jgi:hypothetical protein
MTIIMEVDFDVFLIFTILLLKIDYFNNNDTIADGA